MTRVALLYFHREPLVVRNRLRLLRLFNPDVRIFGIYGGSDLVYARLGRPLRRMLGTEIEDVYHLSGKSRLWKWANTDLAALNWFEAVGRDVEFDSVVLVQWDMLLFAPLDVLYDDVPADTVALTGLVPVSELQGRWPFLGYERYSRELQQLTELARSEFGFTEALHACLGPGACLPRTFLERYPALHLPTLCHDEIRMPLVSRLLGLDLVETGFIGDWFDEEEARYFNAWRGIDRSLIEQQLGTDGGRRAFHPYRLPFALAPLRSRPLALDRNGIDWELERRRDLEEALGSTFFRTVANGSAAASRLREKIRRPDWPY